MKQIKDFDECLEYVNRLGIVNKTKPIGWRQQELCAIVSHLQWLIGGYPFSITFHRIRSNKTGRLVFSTPAFHVVFDYPKV